ncbi:MAG TPA: hypothetical protein PKI19_01905 [Elusimicrobiales bacterium]|nr:hypothetical protein [Elusimicrobiales bacterium]
MTWEDITKRYELEKRSAKLDARLPKMDKKWDNLVKSTDKLVWLFTLSNGARQQSRNG